MPVKRNQITRALALLLLGAGTLSVRAQDPRYVMWVEPDVDACAGGQAVVFRVFLEIRAGAPGVEGWRFGVCHDLQLLQFRSAVAGAATRGVCDGKDAAFVDIRPQGAAAPLGYTMIALLPPPGGAACSLPPGCPYELAVGTYVCTTTISGLVGLACLCDTLGTPPVTAAVRLEDGTEVVPVTLCERHTCEPPPPPPRETCDCTGTDFWLAFPGSLALDPDAVKDLTLMIASETGADVTVEVPGLAISDSFFVPAGDVKHYTLPREVELGLASDAREKKGVHVFTKGEPIQVHGVNDVRYAVDGFLALPTELLGTEHFVLGYANVHAAPRILNGSQLAIVAIEDATAVDITPTADTDGHLAGATFTIALNRGETYQLTNVDALRDLSGTEIASNLPIAVFGGHRCATLPAADEFFCNHNVEQLPPTSLWGTEFLTLPLATRSGGDLFRFLAQADGTDVAVNGLPAAALNRGEFAELKIATRARITSDFPILVGQYAQGSWVDDVDRADPSMMLVQPSALFRDRYLVSTPPNWFENLNFLHVVVPAPAVGTVLLDAAAIPAAAFSPIPTSGFSGAVVKITKGVPHRLAGPAPFGVAAYGFDDFDAYSFPVCFAIGGRQTGSTVNRSIEDDPCDTRPALVTLTAGTAAGRAVTVTEALSPCALIVDAGGGVVGRDGTITFSIAAGQSARYAVDPGRCCAAGQRVVIGGTVGTTGPGGPGDSPCPERVAGDSTIDCCEATTCDTHCRGLDVVASGGTVEAFASADDDSGDPIRYTFQATNGAETFTRGPQPENSAIFDLAPGIWVISVLVADGSACAPPAADATCAVTVTIGRSQAVLADRTAFIRGDANATGAVDISDGVAVLLHLFALGRIDCVEAADVNATGAVDLADAVAVFAYLFHQGARPAPPFPGCGHAPAEGTLRCDAFAACGGR